MNKYVVIVLFVTHALLSFNATYAGEQLVLEQVQLDKAQINQLLKDVEEIKNLQKFQNQTNLLNLDFGKRIPKEYTGNQRLKIAEKFRELIVMCPECAQVPGIPTNINDIHKFPDISGLTGIKPTPVAVDNCGVPKWLESKRQKLATIALKNNLNIIELCEQKFISKLIDELAK